MPWKQIIHHILKSKELCIPFLIFIITGINPVATAIILFQAALIRCYRKHYEGKLRLTKEEKLELAQFAICIPGKWMEEWVTEFKYDTFKKWLKDIKSKIHDHTYRKKTTKVGRPQKSMLIEKFIIRACRENPTWGDRTIAHNASRLYGEVSDTTIWRIRQQHDIPSSLERKNTNWHAFKNCGKVWGMDFFTKDVFTKYGILSYYVLIFVHWESRELIIGGTTPHPTEEWMTRRVYDLDFDHRFRDAKYLVRDNDKIFSKEVDGTFKKIDLKIVKTAIKAPKMYSHTERCVKTIKGYLSENTFGELEFSKEVRAIENFYYTERHHQGLDGDIPFPSKLALNTKGRVKKVSRCRRSQNFYFRESA
jgi:hypothetical protein